MATNITTERVAGEVRAALAKTRTSRQALADALGISLSAITRRLNGEIPFDVAELDQVSHLLEIPLSQLVAAA